MQHKFRSFDASATLAACFAGGCQEPLTPLRSANTTLDVVNVLVLQMKRGAVVQNYKDNSGALVVQLIFEIATMAS